MIDPSSNEALRELIAQASSPGMAHKRARRQLIRALTKGDQFDPSSARTIADRLIAEARRIVKSLGQTKKR